MSRADFRINARSPDGGSANGSDSRKSGSTVIWSRKIKNRTRVPTTARHARTPDILLASLRVHTSKMLRAPKTRATTLKDRHRVYPGPRNHNRKLNVQGCRKDSWRDQKPEVPVLSGAVKRPHPKSQHRKDTPDSWTL